MEVEFTAGAVTEISWIAVDPEGPWFHARLTFSPQLTCHETDDPATARGLIALLNAARCLNPDFLKTTGTYTVNNQLTFNRLWGWGSSSTLISNIARWAQVDPFALNNLISNGSGYDIACARSDSPLIYHLENGNPVSERINFHPAFHEHIAFIYLGRKKRTTEEIEIFRKDESLGSGEIASINNLTAQIIQCTDLNNFNNLIVRHEDIISKVLDRPPIKEIEFSGFNGSIKSLGAWGGDFILASSHENYEHTILYFKERGYPVAFTWNEIIR